MISWFRSLLTYLLNLYGDEPTINDDEWKENLRDRYGIAQPFAEEE